MAAGIEDGGRKMGQGTRDTTHSRSMVFLLSIGSIFKSGPERIRQPFPRGKGSTKSGFSLRKPHRGLRLAFRAGPLPCCRMKRSRTYNRPLSFHSPKRMPLRVFSRNLSRRFRKSSGWFFLI